jgi:beta-phosphoglucomutase-like phosphatase (HAD superfamily)
VLGLEEAFDVIATAEDISRGKPDPEIDLLVAEKMGVPAGAAGVVVVAVPTKLTIRGVRAAGLLDSRWVGGPRSAGRRGAPAHRKRRGESEWVPIAGSSVPCCATARRRGNARL